MIKSLLVLALGTAALIGMPTAGEAQSSTRTARMATTDDYAMRPRAKRRSGTKVYGYRAYRGGYSYSYSDVTNTYGLSRSLYGSNNSWRDPSLDRQTPSGPFDHDFFFDSGVAPRGGSSPYLH